MTELGKTPLYKHKIVTVPDARPVRRNPYRQSPQVRRETENQIQELLENGIIEESNSDWCSPLIMIPKKTGALLRKEAQFQWTPQCQQAFETMKNALLTAPVLSYPDPNRSFILTCDASDKAIGYVLGQKDDEGREYVVAYGGKALSGPEKSYHTSEKECLAILRGVEAYRPYLANSYFTVVTDHSALTWLKSAKLSSRLERWALKLQDLNYDIIHRPGKSNVVADCLSRRPYIEAPTIQSVSTAYPTTDSRLESDTDLDTDRASISGSDELPDGWRTVTGLFMTMRLLILVQ
ncbi:Transposon Tf2-12 polyprotein,Transposon Tf2-11 polyprotein,Transposon Tf2-1 polyprotein,Transposon Tf2-7 polyprotein [Mytilus coruscus]|uniref:Transposon Tf2-12 polyprotein,Transposon Tf2-11 polyprotein,Transposon Tf2-1 polyprotein,Transposon Tf2-7 polyprotein n=1 Tax=Mytilus coruscus TaxID=42192 RepID=A0A6J8CEF9_MYTCO|nr:Transposon Tf2-12 polyprotein,Transposon Tf2-11 polyprotein,Transposon Tf2-1 polyprotein,Transposon Tf2-7 polyprotein [Mytilus coruscus]